MEAMYVGLPIVASDCRGNRDLVKDGEDGYIVPLDASETFIDRIKIIKKNYDKKKYNKINHTLIRPYMLSEVLDKMSKIYNISNTPIRVLQIIGSMNLGGAENFLMNVYRKIDRTKVQFDFVVHKQGVFDDEIKKLGGEIYYIKPLQKVGPIKYKKELKGIFDSKKYRIVHSQIDQVSGFILKVAYQCGIPVRIAHSHSSKNSNSFVGKIYKSYLQKKINKYSTKRYACSDKAGKWLYKRADFEVINNGIDINKFVFNANERKKMRKQYNIDDSTLVIGHVGRFMDAKNHEYLIDIFNDYNKNVNANSALLLIGSGELKEKIILKVNKLNLNKNVIFLEGLTDVYRYYNMMDIFVFPSIYEGLPLTLIEAQVNGLKCLISKNVTSQCQITNKCEFLDINQSSQIWANKITKSENRIVNKNSKKILSFNSQNIANKLCEFYVKNN